VNVYWLVLGVLATWRLTYFLRFEDGPGDIAVRLRQAVGEGFLANALDCFYCLSLWVALPFALLLGTTWLERLLLWLSFSAGSILLERHKHHHPTLPSQSYLEDER
jgi:hypothetical protein